MQLSDLIKEVPVFSGQKKLTAGPGAESKGTECSTTKGTSPSPSLPEKLRNHRERGGQKDCHSQTSKGMGAELCLLDMAGHCTHELTAAVVTYTTHQASQRSSLEEEEEEEEVISPHPRLKSN